MAPWKDHDGSGAAVVAAKPLLSVEFVFDSAGVHLANKM
jgi:hypothetical protein